MISDCYSTWISQSIYTANKLAIARRFVKKVKKIWEAQNQSTSVLSERLLQSLASMGVFTETKIDYFTLTQLVSYI
ncbi:hypothetical protein [Nostoc sp. DedQUE12b]|uniref:hypothetical protein n=1 Tax=Nostoc sp. DedQUE12b TaxID=3075398 RepID=UPI002AD4A764|nr:hypothetical protein [Nostoc sp. DedQUE12b]